MATATSLHYPDQVVTCVPVEPREDRMREPAIIVEVLSPTTADRDRGTKWLAHEEIPRFDAVLVAQDARRVDDFTRATDGWTLKVIRGAADRVELPAIAVELTLAEIYEDSGT